MILDDLCIKNTLSSFNPFEAFNKPAFKQCFFDPFIRLVGVGVVKGIVGPLTPGTPPRFGVLVGVARLTWQ
ncbi:hypothetical protein Hanom_Chr07g00624051 [Helianthus anomalus]